ncbi:MAG: helix-turn-helix domain-containing protein [Gammaproteobacteria bacterium]|nr:helix-turn-helix domain-containing protein [Gammaproteobacteria bacterium]
MEQGSTTVEKALDLLFHLHDAGGAVGVSALGRALDMPKSSVHRLLSAMVRKGIVERDERARYRPGTGLLALGLGVLDREPVVVCARAVLPGFVEEIGETMFLVGRRARKLIVLDKHEGRGLLRVSPTVGSEVPVHCTAAGALFMAHTPEDFSSAAVAAETRDADVDPSYLQNRADAALAKGWSANFELWQSGLSVLAAPVIVRGQIRAAVALAASAPRLAELGGEALAPRVVAAARQIAARAAGEMP